MLESDEARLVAGLLRGSEKALREFYATFYPKLCNFVARRIKLTDDTQEIVQDILLSSLDSLALFSGRSRFSTWIYSIARHEIADYYRKRKLKTVVFSRIPVLETFVTKALAPDALFLRREYERKVKRALGKILPHYRMALEFKYMDGMTVREISQMMGMSLKAAESVLTRARRAFALVYEKLE
jgi:RNA polymerase sigma-70 factor (ECF subfamily)